MTAAGWLTRSLSDVPPADDWLGPGERQVLAGLRFAKRRDDWRLGRWTAKAAVGAWLGVSPQRIGIIAAADGAPEAYLDGRPAPAALSLSHRAGRALCVVCDGDASIGCDLELVEARSDAFIAQWLSSDEQALALSLSGSARARAVNLIWSAKEAAAKARREGLRLDIRSAVVRIPGPARRDLWGRLEVEWSDCGPALGWWRAAEHWVATVVGDPSPAPPQSLDQNSGWRCPSSSL